jgi:hypothetical protein
VLVGHFGQRIQAAAQTSREYDAFHEYLLLWLRGIPDGSKCAGFVLKRNCPRVPAPQLAAASFWLKPGTIQNEGIYYYMENI